MNRSENEAYLIVKWLKEKADKLSTDLARYRREGNRDGIISTEARESELRVLIDDIEARHWDTRGELCSTCYRDGKPDLNGDDELDYVCPDPNCRREEDMSHSPFCETGKGVIVRPCPECGGQRSLENMHTACMDAVSARASAYMMDCDPFDRS